MTSLVTSPAPDGVIVVATAFEDVPTMVGRQFRGEWLVVDPDRLESFAHATYLDENTVELDPTGYPKNLIEGFHLVGLLDHLVNPVVHVSDGNWFGWNYGLDKVRFTSQVHAGEPMRVTGTVAAVEPRGEGYVVVLDCVVEVQGRAKPGFVAQWRAMWLPAPSRKNVAAADAI